MTSSDLLNSNTRGRIELGRIDLMQNFSFFEVPEKEAINVVKSSKPCEMERTESRSKVSSEEGGKGHENGSSERKGGKRFGKGEDRTPRYDNKDRKTKDASTKGPKSGKKEKPSRAERGYSDARGPKKKDGSKSFLKIKEPDFSEEGWHVENLRRNKYEASIIRRFVQHKSEVFMLQLITILTF